MATFTDSVIRGVGQGEQISNRSVRDRSAQLQLQSQELGLRQGKTEQNRFLEKANLESMVQGALELTRIDPQDNQAQIQFLQNRAEQIKDRGGDPRDTLELIQQTPQQRQQTIQSVLTIGERSGLIKPQRTQQAQDLTTMAKGLIEEGFQPNTQAFREELTKRRTAKKSPLVTIEGDKAPVVTSEFQKALGKQQARRFDRIIEDGDAAADTIAAIDIMDNIKVKKGALEPAKAALGGILNALGIDSSSLVNVANVQAFNAVSTTLVNKAMASAKGVQTDADERRFRKTIASISDEETAAGFKNDALRAMALRKVEYKEFIEREIDNENDFGKAIAKWNKHKKETPSLGAIIPGLNNDLPLFVFQYIDIQKKINPDITEEEIFSKWRKLNGE